MKITINNDGLVFDGVRDRIVAHAVGTATCTFELGEHHDLWDGLVITAVWRNGDSVFEQAVTDGQALTVPHEVMAEPGELYVGVYGVKTDGTIVRPELWCDVGQVLSGVPVGGNKETQEPTLDAYQAAYLKVRYVVDHELSREQAEESRVAAEKARADAETARTSAETARADAESKRASAESGRADAESKRVAAETARASAETARKTAENDRDSRQKANDIAQASNNATAAAWKYHVCSSDEYSTSNLHNVPTLTGQSGVVYLTPKVTGATAWCQYDHWLYVGTWELMNDTSNMASYFYSEKPDESAVPSKPSIVYVSDGSSYLVADDLTASAKAAPAWDEEEPATDLADSKAAEAAATGEDATETGGESPQQIASEHGTDLSAVMRTMGDGNGR